MLELKDIGHLLLQVTIQKTWQGLSLNSILIHINTSWFFRSILSRYINFSPGEMENLLSLSANQSLHLKKISGI